MNVRYLVHLAASCGILLALVAVFNLVVDPVGLWRVVWHPGFNVPKARPGTEIAQRKLFGAVEYRPEAVILGNSRADVGFDPSHPALQRVAGRAYNLAVPGAGIGVAVDLLTGLCGEIRPRLVIVGIDFIDFLGTPNDANAVSPSAALRLRTRPNLADKLQSLLTAEATLHSVRSLRAQFAAFPEVILPNGFNPLHEYTLIARSAGYHALFEQWLGLNVSTYGRLQLVPGGSRASEAAPLRALRRLIRTASTCGAELVLVTYPYHSQLLLLFEELGLWPDFERWKQIIVHIVDEEKARVPTSGVRLVDYAFFSGPSQELVPPAEDRSTEMHWYWEAGHFKKELGDVVLATLIAETGDTAAAKVPIAGVPLSVANIDSWLADVRRQKLHFLELHPGDLEAVRRMIARIKVPSG